MERKKYLLPIIFAASAAFSACSNPTQNIEPTITPRKPDATWTLPPEWSATLTAAPTVEKPKVTRTPVSPTQTKTAIPTNTETPVPTDTPTSTETPFKVMEAKIGNIDLSKPYIFNLPKETGDLAGYWTEKTFSIDTPIVVTETVLTDYELKQMDPHNILNDPRVALVFQTDNRKHNHVMVYIHAGYSFIGEELPGNFFRRLLRDSADKAIGAEFALNQDQNATNLQVVDYKIVDETTFNQAFANYVGDSDPIKQKAPVFLRFDTVGIDINKPPYNEENDLVSYVVCEGPIIDITSIRAIITAKVINK